MVSTPDGDKAIETIKAGDIVWSKPEKGGKPFAAAVTATHIRTDQAIYRLKLKSTDKDLADTLLVTPGHPFYVPVRNDFVPAISLKPGDELQSLGDGSSNDASILVESIEMVQPQGVTYNLTVDIGHTFYVGNLKTWVHNTGNCLQCGAGGCVVHATEGPKEVAGTATTGGKEVFAKYTKVNVNDPAADAIAARLGGISSAKFPGKFKDREFDVFSDEFIGQTKPANFQMGSAFRNQAKGTFEAAVELGRKPYFHFDGAPNPAVIEKLNEYGKRYGIEPVIDTTPL
ncbi:restriction endonuclease fold toxin [Pseudomonas sp. PDM13]|uniref:restriction endonuclease fold toxin n=1 Tax=Pseudomonas sp. PDM13 TaxID=2769255 RepID=UPI00398BD844